MWLQSIALFVQLTMPGRIARAAAHSTWRCVIGMSTIEKKLPWPSVLRTRNGSVSHSSPAVGRDVIAGERRDLEIAERHAARPGTSARTVKPISRQDRRAPRSTARRQVDRDRAIELRERRDIEVIVVLVRQDHRVERRASRSGVQHARREHAVAERVGVPKSSHEQRIDEHRGAARPWNIQPWWPRNVVANTVG